jgi:dihydropteroate synthase
VVVGILNVTPDSFSDGGAYLDPSLAAERAHALAADGADLIDIGGESTRPGARAVSADEEWFRVGPVLERLQGSIPVPLAVDTTKADVARRALDLGVAVLNDVSGLAADPRLAILAAETGAGLVLMHMRGEPRTMQENVEYRDLLGEIRDGLSSSLRLAIEAGCAPAQLVVDPGIGFGKSAQGNLRLLAELGGLLALGRPVLVGPSRKSFIGKVLDLPVQDRVEGTVAACVMALERGARLFRVHDVREVRRALDLADSIRRAG